MVSEERISDSLRAFKKSPGIRKIDWDIQTHDEFQSKCISGKETILNLTRITADIAKKGENEAYSSVTI
jgi:hypothetical protein